MSGFRRPRSLQEVAGIASIAPEHFDVALREFLDFFYADAADRGAAIADVPAHLSALADAYLAATGEYLAQRFDLPIPTWTESRGLDLEKPHFAGGLESLKAGLIQESPLAFRRRLIFISRDALDRPRRDAAE